MTIPQQNPQPLLLENGDAVYIRTVTYHYIGRIEQYWEEQDPIDRLPLEKDWIRLVDAAWIAESARWMNTLVEGTLTEVEPMPFGVLIATSAIVDISPWMHELPLAQK